MPAAYGVIVQLQAESFWTCYHGGKSRQSTPCNCSPSVLMFAIGQGLSPRYVPYPFKRRALNIGRKEEDNPNKLEG